MYNKWNNLFEKIHEFQINEQWQEHFDYGLQL